MAAKDRCAYGDIKFFGSVEPVFGSCMTADKSTRQGDVISIPGSVLD